MSGKTKLRDTIALMRRRLAGNEQGATAIEYALIAAGIGAAVAATVYSPGRHHQELLRRPRGDVLTREQQSVISNQRDL